MNQAQISEADFEVSPHDPEWLKVGSARLCTRCGWVALAEEVPA